MHLDTIKMTATGIALYDVDGSYVELSVEDARELSHWLSWHCVKLYTLYGERLEQKKCVTQEQKERQA